MATIISLRFFYSSAWKSIKGVPNLLQGPVQPASRDAEVRLVRGHMVNAVVLSRQHYVPVLQQDDPPGQAPVRVRPFVDLRMSGVHNLQLTSASKRPLKFNVHIKPPTHLIRHGYENGAQEQVRAERVRLLTVRCVLCHQVVGDLAEDGQGQHEIVAIRLDKVVSRYRRRINVVFPEWSQKVLKKPRGRIRVI